MAMCLKEQEHVFWIIQCDILSKHLPQSRLDGYDMYSMITLGGLLCVPLAGMNMDVGFEQSKTKNKLSDWSTLFSGFSELLCFSYLNLSLYYICELNILSTIISWWLQIGQLNNCLLSSVCVLLILLFLFFPLLYLILNIFW